MNLEEENKMTESLKGKKKKRAKELIQQTFGASTCTGVTNTNFELRNSEFKVLEEDEADLSANVLPSFDSSVLRVHPWPLCTFVQVVNCTGVLTQS